MPALRLRVDSNKSPATATIFPITMTIKSAQLFIVIPNGRAIKKLLITERATPNAKPSHVFFGLTFGNSGVFPIIFHLYNRPYRA